MRLCRRVLAAARRRKQRSITPSGAASRGNSGLKARSRFCAPARQAQPDPAPEKDGRSFLERRAAQAEPAHDKDPEQRRESFLELARSILAQSEAPSSGEGARQRAEPPSSVPAPAPDVAEALARGKQAFDVERAIEDGFAAFKAEQAREQAQELAREREAERLRLAEAARQRELTEAAQKLEQEREAERQRGRGHGMER